MEYELQGYLERWVLGAARRTATLVAVFVAVVSALGLCSAAAARADGIELCDGYAQCSAGPYTTNGYPSAADISWWRMYPGVNCTNYAAYVESQIFGVATPDYDLGNAGQWAANAAAEGVEVNDTPSVGAVAVWGAGTAGIGSYGHVGIVQAVGPGGSYIDISQDDMHPDIDGYDWERIYAGSSQSWEPWPSSFIHFAGSRIPQAAGNPLPNVWIGGDELAVPGM